MNVDKCNIMKGGNNMFREMRRKKQILTSEESIEILKKEER